MGGKGEVEMSRTVFLVGFQVPLLQLTKAFPIWIGIGTPKGAATILCLIIYIIAA